jgi:hypothetical protein
VDEMGELVVEDSFVSTKKGLDQVFGAMTRCRLALEVGTRSPSMSRLLTGLPTLSAAQGSSQLSGHHGDTKPFFRSQSV